ncbi:MAG: rubredoxin [Halieaceae bacterium]|jgi:rubredoxin
MSEFKQWECVICGFVYDEAKGLPEDGIPAGTVWEDIPEDWECPDCGIGKMEFDMVEG